MKKLLLLSALMVFPAAAFADVPPIPEMSCDQCVATNCYNCCTNEMNTHEWDCWGCRNSCDYAARCADYLTKNPDKCPKSDTPSQDTPSQDTPSQDTPSSDNNQSKSDNDNSSCSTMIHTSGNTGLWAMLAAGMFGLIAIGGRRRKQN